MHAEESGSILHWSQWRLRSGPQVDPVSPAPKSVAWIIDLRRRMKMKRRRKGERRDIEKKKKIDETKKKKEEKKKGRIEDRR